MDETKTIFGTPTEEKTFKVGELARRTGLTVRTLHHYDEIGLLVPSRRTVSDHRLYGFDDLDRLQRILSLRQLGFSLDEIAGCLDRSDFSLLAVLDLHVARLRERLEHERRLCDRLETVARQLRAAERVSTDALLQTIEVTTMFEQYYTSEQLEQLKTRRDTLGPEGMARGQNDWAELMTEARDAMERGIDPASDEAQTLGRRWQALIAAFTGGDPGITASLRRVYDEAPAEAEKAGGPDPALRDFMAKVNAAASS